MATTIPTNPSGSPTVRGYAIKMLAAAAGSDVTSEGVIVHRTGYLTRAAYIAQSTLTGANTDSRTLTVVSPTTRAITDGIVAVLGTSAFKGSWASGAYSTGDIVVYNNTSYVAIASVTTEAPTDTTKWEPVSSFGLGYLHSRSAAFTKDDIDRSISGTGYSSAVITDVLDAKTAAVTPNSAIRNALSVTIGSSRTLATLAYTSGVNATADVPSEQTLSTTDVKVYKGDVLKVVSTHVGGTGLADPGGTMWLEVTSYGEGS